MTGPSRISTDGVPSTAGEGGTEPQGSVDEYGGTARVRRKRPRRKGRRSRDLSPEDDNRRRQRRVIALILPAILGVTGGVVWALGAWNVDPVFHLHRLVRLGKTMLAIGSGVFVVLLVREWSQILRENLKERREHPKAPSHRRRSGRRRHRSAKPSALRIE